MMESFTLEQQAAHALADLLATIQELKRAEAVPALLELTEVLAGAMNEQAAGVAALQAMSVTYVTSDKSLFAEIRERFLRPLAGDHTYSGCFAAIADAVRTVGMMVNLLESYSLFWQTLIEGAKKGIAIPFRDVLDEVRTLQGFCLERYADS